MILVDDMVDTAGTLCEAAAILKASGARRIFAFATHGVLSGPALKRIANSKLEELVWQWGDEWVDSGWIENRRILVRWNLEKLTYAQIVTSHYYENISLPGCDGQRLLIRWTR